MIKTGLGEVRMAQDGIITIVEVEMNEVVATTVVTDLVKSSPDNLGGGTKKV